jgi:hypothetical protein
VRATVRPVPDGAARSAAAPAHEDAYKRPTITELFHGLCLLGTSSYAEMILRPAP